MRGAWLVVLLLAGCMSARDAPDPEEDVPEPARLAYVPIDEARLSGATHTIGERQSTYVTSADEVRLFVEWWLPDGDGPWPTILHSTPYSHLDRPLGGSSYRDFYVPRGYAFAVADVRGFGESEGCVTIWGPDEQRDQQVLVEWIADQDWSDGNVGMVGVSYPGTTPIEAAVMAPEPLKAVVAVAGLTDPYFDWHYGGVPNSEPSGSAVAYFGIGSVVPQNVAGGPDWATAAAHGRCTDPPVVAESYRTDGLYTEFYEERNFSARVQDIQAAVLYSQGFTDSNVKPSQLLNFFNEVPTTKKGFFGQWAHSNPTRPDWKLFEQAWFDEHLKGMDTGVLDGPVVEVVTNAGTWRADTHWPPRADQQAFHLDGSMALAAEPGSGDVAVQAQSRLLDEGSTEAVFTSAPLEAPLHIAGDIRLRFNATIDTQNAFFEASLHDVDATGSTRITFGMLNAALRDGYDTYRAVPDGAVGYDMPFQPREYIVPEGHRIELRFSIQDASQAQNPEANAQVHAILHTDGSHLALPVLPAGLDTEPPWE